MGLVTFAINLTLDGCYDHREGVPDADLHDYFTQLMAPAGAMLYGRTTYELMEAHWPAVARDESAPRSQREFARMLESKPKYVMSTTRRDFPWANTFHVEGDVKNVLKQLAEKNPKGLLLSGTAIAVVAEQLGLIDEYRLVIHPVFAGHGPTLFQGLERRRVLDLVSTNRMTSGAVAMHYRRKEG